MFIIYERVGLDTVMLISIRIHEAVCLSEKSCFDVNLCVAGCGMAIVEEEH